MQAVLDAVKKIAADSRESLASGKALKDELEKISLAIGSFADLSHAASTEVGSAEAALGSFQTGANDTARKTEELAATDRSLRGMLTELDKALRMISRTRHRVRSRARDPGADDALPLSLGIVPVSPAEEAPPSAEVGQALAMESRRLPQRRPRPRSRSWNQSTIEKVLPRRAPGCAAGPARYEAGFSSLICAVCFLCPIDVSTALAQIATSHTPTNRNTAGHAAMRRDTMAAIPNNAHAEYTIIRSWFLDNPTARSL